jgi:hypothetical protein
MSSVNAPFSRREKGVGGMRAILPSALTPTLSLREREFVSLH